MKKIMVGIRETFGKTGCVLSGILLLLFFILLIMAAYRVSVDKSIPILVVSLFLFLCSISLFEASAGAYLEDIEEVPVPFFHSLDEEGKEVTLYRKLKFLKEMFCGCRMDLEEYEKRKNGICDRTG